MVSLLATPFVPQGVPPVVYSSVGITSARMMYTIVPGNAAEKIEISTYRIRTAVESHPSQRANPPHTPATIRSSCEHSPRTSFNSDKSLDDSHYPALRESSRLTIAWLIKLSYGNSTGTRPMSWSSLPMRSMITVKRSAPQSS